MKLHNGWESVNGIVLALHLLFPVWIISWMYTPGISTVLLLTALVLNLALGGVHKLVVMTDKGKPVLHVFRVLALLSLLAAYAPLAILSGFTTEMKVMYPAKRAMYIYGVYSSSSDYYSKLLPETLPQQCGSYSFRAQGSVIAQDYHPTSWLRFSTDRAALDGYAAYYDAQGFTRSTSAVNYRWVIQYFGITCAEDATVPEDTVFYYISGNYPKAVVLDYAEEQVFVLT